MGKHRPFESAMIRRFVSPLFAFLHAIIKSHCASILALFGTVGKQWENKNAVHEARGSKNIVVYEFEVRHRGKAMTSDYFS